MTTGDLVEDYAGFWDWFHSVAWLEWAKVTFDLFKGVAWPLGLFCIVFLFREQLRARIPYMQQVGPTGAIFAEPQPQGPLTSPAPLSVDHPLQTVTDLASAIGRELEEIAAEHRQNRLIKALAEARTLADFEAIFAVIFQSQINALAELAERPYTIAEAERYFEEFVAPLNPELYTEWGFDQWSQFLISQRLVVANSERVEITQKGKDFLDFAVNYKRGFRRAN